MSTKGLPIGSAEWRRERRLELLKMSFDELQDYEMEIYGRYDKERGWASDYDYYSLGVITDIEHWDYYDQFKAKYPKIMFSAIRPHYLEEEGDKPKAEKVAGAMATYLPECREEEPAKQKRPSKSEDELLDREYTQLKLF